MTCETYYIFYLSISHQCPFQMVPCCYAEGIVLTNFFCQNCGQAIQLDTGFLESQTLQDSASPSFRKPQSKQLPQSANRRSSLNSRLQKASSGEHHPQDSFIILPTATYAPPDSSDTGSLSHRLQVANRLFELISGTSTIDHPMCQECANDLLDKLEKRLIDLKSEKKAYETYLEQAENTKVPSKEADIVIEELEASKAESDQQLKQFEANQQQLDTELDHIKSELRKLDLEELK